MKNGILPDQADSQGTCNLVRQSAIYNSTIKNTPKCLECGEEANRVNAIVLTIRSKCAGVYGPAGKNLLGTCKNACPKEHIIHTILEREPIDRHMFLPET